MFQNVGGRIARNVFPDAPPEAKKFQFSGTIGELSGEQRVVTFSAPSQEEAERKYNEYKLDWDIKVLTSKIAGLTAAAKESNDMASWLLVNRLVNKLFCLRHPEYVMSDANAQAMTRAAVRILGRNPLPQEWTTALVEAAFAEGQREIVDTQGVSLESGRVHQESLRKAQESLEAANAEQAALVQQEKDQTLINEFESLSPERQKMFVHHSGDRVWELNRAYARRKSRLGY